MSCCDADCGPTVRGPHQCTSTERRRGNKKKDKTRKRAGGPSTLRPSPSHISLPLYLSLSLSLSLALSFPCFCLLSLSLSLSLSQFLSLFAPAPDSSRALGACRIAATDAPAASLPRAPPNTIDIKGRGEGGIAAVDDGCRRDTVQQKQRFWREGSRPKTFATFADLCKPLQTFARTFAQRGGLGLCKGLQRLQRFWI